MAGMGKFVRRAVLGVGALVALSATASAQGAVSVSPASTAVRVSVNSFFLPVKGGSFNDVSGAITVDFARPERSRIAVKVDARTLDAGVPRYNAFLRGASVFDVARYPSMTFTSTRMTRIDDTHARFDGLLTMRGVTRPLSVIATAVRDPANPRGPTRFTARGQLNRLEFGIDRGYPLVTAMVDFVLTTQPSAD
ncbi:YceI family protein [Roseiarcaceae bacterium H3SJ34-1]|uniref:YceI family protein n=1 Tax=Terripilifer ovatus TaxID=3032367 RepID=UPI003AB95A27|nr:YceI family protein [Roseiarcaceae bacterium H3SJ34-1]